MTTTSFSYEPLSAHTLANPFAAYDVLREDSPVYWHDGMSAWVVSRYADCREVLRNHTVFARDPRRAGRDFPADKENIQTQDPPHQAQLRQIVMRTLHEQDLAGICREAREQMERDLEARAGTGPFEFLSELAGPAAIGIINRVVGIDGYSAEGYHHIFRGLTRSMDSGLDPARVEPGIATGVELKQAVDAWLDRDDVQGMLAGLGADDAVRAMTKSYVRNTMAGVYNAGFSTVYASMGSITKLVLERPELIDALRDEKVRTTAGHELLRYLSPAQATSRTAVEPVTLSGTEIKPGEMVVTLIAAANRDPRVFDRPDELVLDRWPNAHLGFAWGPHVCLGSSLALAWIEEFVQLMAGAAGRLAFGGEPEYLDSATLRTLVRLPLTYAPAPGGA